MHYPDPWPIPVPGTSTNTYIFLQCCHCSRPCVGGTGAGLVAIACCCGSRVMILGSVCGNHHCHWCHRIGGDHIGCCCNWGDRIDHGGECGRRLVVGGFHLVVAENMLISNCSVPTTFVQHTMYCFHDPPCDESQHQCQLPPQHWQWQWSFHH